MSSFKRINPSDIYQNTLVSNKQWTFTYTSSSYDTNIQCYKGTNVSTDFSLSSSAVTNNVYEQLEFNKINQLFYHQYSDYSLKYPNDRINSLNYISASNYRNTSSYFNYDENPLIRKTFPLNVGDSIKTIYVDKDIYGNKILPGSFIISSSDYYILDDGFGNLADYKYVLSGSNINYIELSGSYEYVDYNYIQEYLSGSGIPIPVGNIFYSFGLSIITDQYYQNLFPMPSTGSIVYSFQNEWNTYENYIYCKIQAEHFNLTYNPTLLKSGSADGTILDFATSSFSPYATAVGLYNDDNELLAIAKLSQPLYLSPELTTNIIIKYDT